MRYLDKLIKLYLIVLICCYNFQNAFNSLFYVKCKAINN